MKAENKMNKLLVVLVLLAVFISGIEAWTGEIHGRVICDVCGDSALGPEDHILEGPFFPPCNTLLFLYSSPNDEINNVVFWVSGIS